MTTKATREKVRENRLRRAAARRKWKLVKTRRYDPAAYDYGTYTLLVPGRRHVLPNLDAVEIFLKKNAPWRMG